MMYTVDYLCHVLYRMSMVTQVKQSRKSNRSPLAQPLRLASWKRELPPAAKRRVARLGAGVTQESIAQAIGVTRQAITQWESGVRDPRGNHLRRYVTILRRLSRQVAS